MKTVLFFRQFSGFAGGHLKVFDYYSHLRHASDYMPEIHFYGETVWSADNPWLPFKEQAVGSWQSVDADIHFLAGLDWTALPEGEMRNPSIPRINLIQHVRHGDPTDPRFRFLKYKAVRICVSEEVRSALSRTGIVNGPLIAIPNCIDLGSLPRPRSYGERDVDVLVSAVKNPDLGRELVRRLAHPGRRFQLRVAYAPRADFLQEIGNAQVTVFVPNPTEGFYLPALEGMALGTVVVCPDCVGNRSFCLPGRNCFRPGFRIDEIVQAALAALDLGEAERRSLLDNAFRTATEHDLSKERQAFYHILRNLETLWQS